MFQKSGGSVLRVLTARKEPQRDCGKEELEAEGDYRDPDAARRAHQNLCHVTSFVNVPCLKGGIGGGADLTEPRGVQPVNDNHTERDRKSVV